MNNNTGGSSPAIFQKIINSNSHILVAGCTGSGKSTVINGIIKTGLSSQTVHFILIDLKKVELSEYRKNKLVINYIDNIQNLHALLNHIENIVNIRLNYMQKIGIKKYSSSDKIIIVIDEMIDLIINGGRESIKKLEYLLTVSRAAGVFFLIGSQRVTTDILPPLIKCNCDLRIGLHTVTRQDSKNIIGCSGCEDLPRFGKALVVFPGEKPYITDIPLI